MEPFALSQEQLSPEGNATFPDSSKSCGNKSSNNSTLLTLAMKKSYPDEFNDKFPPFQDDSSSNSTKSKVIIGLLRCLECSQTFQDNKSLRDHFLEIHKSSYGNDGVSFTCPHCNQTFPCSITLKVHQQEHVLPNVQQFSNSINHYNNTKDNHQTNGSNSKQSNRLLSISYVCDICDKSYPYRDLLVDHSNIHLLGHFCHDETCQKIYGRHNHSSYSDSNNHTSPNSNNNNNNVSNHSMPSGKLAITLFNSETQVSPAVKKGPSGPPPPLLLSSDLHKMPSTNKNNNKNNNRNFIAITKSLNKNSNKTISKSDPHVVSHNGRKRFQCKICHKFLSSKTSHEEHSRVHTGEKPYKCDYCAKTYAVKNTYRQHMAAHRRPIRNGSSNNYSSVSSGGGGGVGGGSGNANVSYSSSLRNSKKCTSCGESFSSQDKFDYHSCKHLIPSSKKISNGTGNNNSVGGFKCKICGKMFAKKEWRKTHYLSHAGETCFRCEVCGDIFPDEEVFLVHAQVHFCSSEIKRSFYNCKVCGKTFPGKDLYEKHSCRFAGVNSSG